MINNSLPESAPAIPPEPNRDPTPEPIAEPPTAEPPIGEPPTSEPTESFADLLSAFEKTHSHKAAPGAKQLQGIVVSLSADQVFLDIGYKTEGVLPRTAFPNNAEAVKPGDSFPVSVNCRTEEH